MSTDETSVGKTSGVAPASAETTDLDALIASLMRKHERGYRPAPATPATSQQPPAAPLATTAVPPSFVDPYAEFVGAPFPADVLSPTLDEFVEAERRAMGADPSAIAMAAITAVAGAIHAETLVQGGEGWWERPILWTALVGNPSTMKSPIIAKVTKPLIRIDHERGRQWQEEYVKWQESNG